MKICITATDAVMCVGEEAAIGDTESKWGKEQARLLSQPGLPTADSLLSISNDILKVSIPTLTII